MTDGMPHARNHVLGAAIRAGARYFAWVFGAGFVLGTVRVTLLVPRLGVRAAELLEMPVMLAVIVWSARHVVRGRVPPALSARLLTGGVALVLLVASEVVLAVASSGQSLAQYVAGRDPVSGSVYLAMLGVYAALPALLTRREEDSNAQV